MDRKERDFWNRVRGALSRKVFVRRIENGVSGGDPDVFMMKQGRIVWLELKYCEVPVKRTSKLLGKGNVRLDQINWHLEYAWKGGTSFVLIGTPFEDYLMPGGLADKLNDMSLEEIEQNAVARHKSIQLILEQELWK